LKKFISGALFGLLLSLGTVVYGSSPIQEFLVSVKYYFNYTPVELGDEYATINYNGHVYVPIRFITETMGAEIEYDERSKAIYVKQPTVKIDDYTLAPMPMVNYENRSRNGSSLWMQEIPLLQGSACWRSCIDTPKPASLMKSSEYPPVPVKPGSGIFIKYPKGMEPKILEASIITGDDLHFKKTEALTITDQRLTVPKKEGTYLIWIKSEWAGGADTSYYFAIEVKE